MKTFRIIFSVEYNKITVKKKYCVMRIHQYCIPKQPNLLLPTHGSIEYKYGQQANISQFLRSHKLL